MVLNVVDTACDVGSRLEQPPAGGDSERGRVPLGLHLSYLHAAAGLKKTNAWQFK